ncbi:carbohydrate sulfotransferase 4 [Spodoptera frugiperda]|uniref:Carbohydrate sulfotransferase 4 n=2 Tax=Spodoptera frugiperda TaxID=7108 RepID=A0A9R0EXG2_SPOFR|nr:carbohydrate sulfotransferase 4 [Spodoptera frugiperda]XP_050553096.1 carbohydrate sulfotransferase 4 [Spodoptera frugiperda]XP_050553097.1 carbohydrate sulfotransferase 4 [Spodoptera frugiperda]XP_050553098.1 carbohydrate sulfotransferase 4 [Spodoptera frugiperda]
MLRRVNFYSICFAFGISVLLIFVGSRYADNTYYRPSIENRRNVRNFLKVGDEAYTLLNIPTILYDGSPDIKILLEKTRSKIKYELSKYNFSEFGAQALENLVIESGGQPIRSLIISTWRSGTTFLGQLLNAIPGTYYHYEPLLKYGIIQIRGPPDGDKAVDNIKSMMKCDYEGLEDYFNFGKKHLYQFTHNTRLWDHCKHKNELCFDADFTSRICKLFPFQTMKVVRLRLRLIQDVLKDKELNLKVILLIRDPRGVLQSRQHRTFCQTSADCWDPPLLCADMISDYVAAARIQKHFPDRLMVLRYEELALQPNVTAYRILKFLNISATGLLDEFLDLHTNVEVAGVSSTFRVSKEVPFKWKNTLNFTYVDDIQRACKEAMSLWGYKMANNETHMKSEDFMPLDNYTISQ